MFNIFFTCIHNSHSFSQGNVHCMFNLLQDSHSSAPSHSGSWSRHSLLKATLTQSVSTSPGQSHESFVHGKHHSHSQDTQDTYGKQYETHGKSSDGKLQKDTHPKLHQPHGPTLIGGNQGKVPRKKGESGSEVSDCGYGTQQENQESNSTSSNEEDTPQR